MATINFVCVFIIAACFNVVLTQWTAEDIDDNQESSIQARTVGRAYSLSSCNYKLQVGYSCLTCNRALHCYPGDIAILVDCYGLFRFCRDGRCSRFQGDKCLTDTKLTTPGPSNDPVVIHTAETQTIENVNSSQAATKQLTGAEAVTEKIAASMTEIRAEIETRNDAENALTQVSTTNAKSVTETVIIPIDDTTSPESSVSLTNFDDTRSNVV